MELGREREREIYIYIYIDTDIYIYAHGTGMSEQLLVQSGALLLGYGPAAIVQPFWVRAKR